MREKCCPKCHGPAKIHREEIYWQLGMLSNIIRDAPEHDFSDADYCGMMVSLREIAEKIFPEALQGDAQ